MNNSLNIKISLSSIFKFTVPSIIMMIILSLYTVIDGIFVAKLVGTNAFSAVNIVYPVISIIVAIGTMFGTGFTSTISRKIGENRLLEVRQDFTFSIIIIFLVGLLITGVTFLFLEEILYFLGANDVIYKYCYDYSMSLLWSFPLTALNIQLISYYSTNGTPKICLLMTILGGIINIFLDYIFIGVFKFGIAGAGFATGLGYSIPAIFGLIYFSLNKKGNLFFVKPKKNKNVLFKSVINGSSEMVSNLATSITTLLFNKIMMYYIGENGVAAVSIVLYIDFFLVAASLGYGVGIIPLISYNYGSGNTDNLKKLYKISINLSIIAGIIITIVTLMFAKNIVSVFATIGSEVFNLAFFGLKIYSVSYVFKGINIFASSMFTALSNGKLSAFISFSRSFLFTVLGILVLTLIFGVNGVWISIPFAELISFVLTIVLLLRYKNIYNY